jgi:hypothetical protein
VRCPQTNYGERVWLCGGPSALGAWSPARALRLRWAGDGRWQAVAQIEALQDPSDDADKVPPHLEFKALLAADGGGSAGSAGRGGRWEVGRERNRRLLVSVAEGGKVEARAGDGSTRVTVLPDGASVRVELDATF